MPSEINVTQPSALTQSAIQASAAKPVLMNESDQKQGLPGASSRGRIGRLLRHLNSRDYHTWIQSSALLIAAIWGIYTFVWSDILVPSWAPAHINLSVSLKTQDKINITQPVNSNGIEASLVIKADNPSSRKLYLLSNVWQVFEGRRQQTSPEDFQAVADRRLRESALRQAERYSERETIAILAMGRAFDDNIIQPGESITRTISIRIPKQYTSFDVNITLPALTKPPNPALFKGRRLEWGLDKEEGLVTLLCDQPNSNTIVEPGNERNLKCTPVPAGKIEVFLKSFDSRMQIFSKSEQLMPELSSSDP